MKKLVCTLLGMLLAFLPVIAGAELDCTPFFEGLEGLTKFDEPVTITMCRTIDPTAQFDESDPEKKNYSENRWVNAALQVLNVDLDYAWISPDGDSDNAKWAAAIASGNIPDAAFVSDGIYKELYESNLIMDVTDIFEAEASQTYRSMLNEDTISSVSYNGRMYAFPKPGNAYIGNGLLFVRNDWLAKVGLETPKTMDDVIATARAFKEAKLGGEDTIGMMFADGDGVLDGLLKGFMNGYGAYRDIWVDVDGKLAWSNTLPEMREALLALQGMYAEGLINEDFAVTNGTVAQEYVSSGKCGIMYCIDYATCISLLTLVNMDSEADISCIGIPGRTEGEETKVQTYAIKAGKLIVSKKCAHPEAVIRLMNLWVYGNQTMDEETFRNFYAEKGFLWYKQIPCGNIVSVTNDIVMSNDCRHYIQTGEFVNTVGTFNTADTIKAMKDPSYPWSYPATHGEFGSYTLDYDLYVAGRQLPDAFTDVPTETMSMLGDIVNDALDTAMINVIMGADISTYDAAVEKWFANGGQQITDEVNEWYAAK